MVATVRLPLRAQLLLTDWGNETCGCAIAFTISGVVNHVIAPLEEMLKTFGNECMKVASHGTKGCAVAVMLQLTNF
jgi:hypothetical protein